MVRVRVRVHLGGPAPWHAKAAVGHGDGQRGGTALDVLAHVVEPPDIAVCASGTTVGVMSLVHRGWGRRMGGASG